MRLDDVVGDMRRAGEGVPRVAFPIPLEAPRWGAAATEPEVKDLEMKAGQPLPADYRTFLLRYGSVQAMDVFNGYDLFGARQALAVTREGDGPRYIDTGAATLPVLTIGGDGGGNLFLLVAGSGGAFRWLHERGTGHQRIARTSAVEQLAEDFTAFLGRIAEDWKHFVAGDGGWKYISG